MKVYTGTQIVNHAVFKIFIMIIFDFHKKKLFSVNKLNINESCSSSSLCNDQVGLNCLNGICACPVNQYFKDQICQNSTVSISTPILNYFSQDLIFTRIIIFFPFSFFLLLYDF
jgi:hypothetical protein